MLRWGIRDPNLDDMQQQEDPTGSCQNISRFPAPLGALRPQTQSVRPHVLVVWSRRAATRLEPDVGYTSDEYRPIGAPDVAEVLELARWTTSSSARIRPSD